MKQNSKRTLVDEIVENARRDRRRLEAVAEGLTNGFGTLGDSNGDEAGGTLDPEVSAAFAEELAKVTDSLSKINQQLIELVKVESKREENKTPDQPAKLSKEDKEALYEQLQEDLN